MMLLSLGLAARSPSHVPIHHWDFGRHILLVLQGMQGLAVMKTWAADISRLLCECIICSSSSPAPGALPGRWEVRQVLSCGAERCWEPWAGQGRLEL